MVAASRELATVPQGKPTLQEQVEKIEGIFDEAAALCDRCALCVGVALLCLLALRRGCTRGRMRMVNLGKVE